jgi:hypothetical protein
MAAFVSFKAYRASANILFVYLILSLQILQAASFLTIGTMDKTHFNDKTNVEVSKLCYFILFYGSFYMILFA